MRRTSIVRLTNMGKTSNANANDMAMSLEEADAVLAKHGFVDSEVRELAVA